MNSTLAKVHTSDPNLRPSKRQATEVLKHEKVKIHLLQLDKQATMFARYVLGPQPSKELCKAYEDLTRNPDLDTPVDPLSNPSSLPINQTNLPNLQTVATAPKSVKDLRALLQEKQEFARKQLEEEERNLKELGIAEEIYNETVRLVEEKGGNMKTLISLLQAHSEQSNPTALESLSGSAPSTPLL